MQSLNPRQPAQAILKSSVKRDLEVNEKETPSHSPECIQVWPTKQCTEHMYSLNEDDVISIQQTTSSNGN